MLYARVKSFAPMVASATRRGQRRFPWLNRFRLMRVLAVIVVLAALFAGRLYARRKWHSISEFHRTNGWSAVLPRPMAISAADKKYPREKWFSHPAQPAILAAPWMGTFPTPVLGPPVRNSRGELTSPLFLMLHIFSTPNEGGVERRAFLRQYSPCDSVPEGWRHLVECKFVLGYPEDVEDGEEWLPRAVLDAEQEAHGDLVLLEGLDEGENMNLGKSVQWIQHVGRHSSREAQWVAKTDEDTLILMPNFLDWLTALDPEHPTYFGTSLGRWYGMIHYYQGMLYGFSWSVVKTIAAAEIPREYLIQSWHEDARTGEIMFMLPTKPGVNPHSLTNDHSGWVNMTDPPRIQDINPLRPPQSPDPRTGLYRVDLLNRIGDWGQWWQRGVGASVGFHWLKSEEQYTNAVRYVTEWFRRHRREYRWQIPYKFRRFGENDKKGRTGH